MLGFAVLGFVGGYIMFFAFRWWPTMHDDGADDASPVRGQIVKFVCALIAAMAAALASIAF